MDITKLLRKNIQALKPYSSARDEFTGEAMVYLDANENPFNKPYNRYPDPLQRKLKAKIAELKNTSAENIFLGNGSDEPIDLLIRAFCEPQQDNIVSIDPTYGMYKVAADISGIEYRAVSLNDDFSLNLDGIFEAIDSNTKLIFLCSPNNPTGNLLEPEKMEKLLKTFNGIVILDEAYIDFAPGASFLSKLNQFPNLVILQTFSKAWGMAAIRLGMAFASEVIVAVLNKIKYPYNLNILTQEKGLELLDNQKKVQEWINFLLAERRRLSEKLCEFPFVVEVFPSDANFILVKTHDARGLYDYLVEEGIIVRDRSKVHLCDSALRITIGSFEENENLINALKNLI